MCVCVCVRAWFSHVLFSFYREAHSFFPFSLLPLSLRGDYLCFKTATIRIPSIPRCAYASDNMLCTKRHRREHPPYTSRRAEYSDGGIVAQNDSGGYHFNASKTLEHAFTSSTFRPFDKTIFAHAADVRWSIWATRRHTLSAMPYK